MKKLLPLLAIAALLLGTGANAAQTPSTRSGQAAQGGEAMYEAMRTMVLAAGPADLGIETHGPQLIVYGIVMESDLSGRTATMVSFSTGDASLYLSHGGGMIGGIDHANVAAASRDFVAAARLQLGAMARTRSTPRPGRGQTIFYVHTTAGLRTATRPTARLEDGADPLSPLFLAGQRVLTEFRGVEARR